jgi:hypothetical protein
MYQSGISIIVYVSIRGTNHSVCINQGYQSYRVYQSRVSIHLIDTYTLIDTADWYIHYDWHTWLIHTLWLITLIDTCNNQVYQSYCMYQPGGSIIVYVSIRVDVSLILHVLIIMDLLIPMIDTPDWCIHWVKHPLWLIHTLWVIHPLWLIHTLWLFQLVDTYTIMKCVSIRFINHSVCINQVDRS